MIQLVVITDDHSWVAGHKYTPITTTSNTTNNVPLDADYGHVVSFYERLKVVQEETAKNHNTKRKKKKTEEEGATTFLIHNGDFMDGTGLSTYPPLQLVPILQAMPWDVMTLGNHDIYNTETVQYLLSPESASLWTSSDAVSSSSLPSLLSTLASSSSSVLRRNKESKTETEDEPRRAAAAANDDKKVGWWQQAPYMVTSNLVHRHTQQPIGQRFLYLHDPRTDRTVLVLGFLFDTIDTAVVGSPLVHVEAIHESVASTWFRTVVQNITAYDAILVLAHMSLEDPNIALLLSSIRQLTTTSRSSRRRRRRLIPVQFITGHTHLLQTKVLDACAVAVESGKYLETIGLVSFPTKQDVQHHHTNNNNNNSSCLELFSHEILPANIEVLTQRVNNMNMNTNTNTTVTTTAVAAAAAVATTKTTTGSNLMTLRGQYIQNQIHTTQQQMGLNRVLGCTPHTYLLNQTFAESNSLFGLWYHSVLQKELQASLTATATSTNFSSNTNTNTNTKTNTNNIAVLQGTRSSFRYDLYKGIITMNDIMIVSPFNDTVYLVQHNISLPILLQLESYMNGNALKNNNNNADGFLVPDFLLLTIPDIADTHDDEEAKSNINNRKGSSSNKVVSNDDNGNYYDLYTLEYEVPFIHKGLQHILGTTTAIPQKQPRPTTVGSTALWIQFIESQWSLSSASSTTSSFCQQQYQHHLKQQQQYHHSREKKQQLVYHQHQRDISIDNDTALYMNSNKNNVVVAVTVATIALLVSIFLFCRILGCMNKKNYNRIIRRRT